MIINIIFLIYFVVYIIYLIKWFRYLTSNRYYPKYNSFEGLIVAFTLAWLWPFAFVAKIIDSCKKDN